MEYYPCTSGVTAYLFSLSSTRNRMPCSAVPFTSCHVSMFDTRYHASLLISCLCFWDGLPEAQIFQEGARVPPWDVAL